MHIIQDILIVLLAGYMTIDQNGPVVMSWFSVIVGTISGLIMGDLNTGLMIGGTFQLMSLGVYVKIPSIPAASEVPVMNTEQHVQSANYSIQKAARDVLV